MFSGIEVGPFLGKTYAGLHNCSFLGKKPFSALGFLHPAWVPPNQACVRMTRAKKRFSKREPKGGVVYKASSGPMIALTLEP